MRLVPKDELEGALDYDAIQRLEREGWWVVQGPPDTVRLEKSKLLETRDGLVLQGLLQGKSVQFKVLADLDGQTLEVTLEDGYVVDTRGV